MMGHGLTHHALGPYALQLPTCLAIITFAWLSTVLMRGELLCPVLTPGFAGEIYPFLRVFSGCHSSQKTPHHLSSGILDYHGHGGHSAQHDGGLGKLKCRPKV